jgi:hypothetical protein
LCKDLTKNKKDSISKSLFRYFPEAKKMLIGDKVTTTKLEQLGKSIFDNPASRFGARAKQNIG